MLMPRLRRFQREDVELIKKHKLRVLVASSPGTGKTLVAIRSISESAGSLPVVVICPASVVHNWKKEFGVWAPHLKVHVIEDTTTRPPRSPIDVFVISWSLLDLWEPKLSLLPIKTIVADECHMSKNPEALRSQALYRLAQDRPGLLQLSGTPMVNNESELNVLKTLFGHEPLIIRRLLEEVAPDVPIKKRAYLPVQLRPHHQTIYDQANNDFLEWLRKHKEKVDGDDADLEGSIEAEALVKIGYLRRIVGEAKVPAAADWVARMVRLGEPVIVFAEHQQPLKKLSKSLHRQRIRHCLLDGAVSTKNRQKMVDDFQAHVYPVFLCSKAGKEGITLTAARHVLFLERYFTSAEEEQAEDRSRRIGQLHPTTMWYLHAVGTVDERIDEIVRTKRDLIQRNLRSVTTVENSEVDVKTLLRQWESHLTTGQAPSRLGLGDPLPSLPRPRDTHAIVFKGSRWVKRSALLWCKMNGFEASRVIDLGNRLQLVIHPAQSFTPGKFRSFKVSEDIHVLVGDRISAALRKQAKAARSERGVVDSV